MSPDSVLVTDPRELAPLSVGPRDAARLIGISEKTLWTLTAPRGPIPAAKIGGRVLYRVASIDAWLVEQEKQQHTA